MLRLWILFACMTGLMTACNLSSPAASDTEITLAPTTIPTMPPPTRTPVEVVETQENPSNVTTNVSNNTTLVAPRDTQTVICTKQSTWNTYTVVAGDTLFSIAQRANATVDTLVSANCLVDASLIEVGQVLYVPQPVQPLPADDDDFVPDPNRYTVELWWIIQGDGGNTGFAVGCGDSIYLQQSGIPANLSMDETIRRAFTYLTDDNNRGAGQADRGWWNPMAQTAVSVESYSINGQQVTMNLIGQLNLSGVCFDAQLEPQLALNIMDLTNTTVATINVNGQNLRQLMDMSGQETRTTYTWDEFQTGVTGVPTNQLIDYWVGIETNGASNESIEVGCGSYVMPITGDIAVSGDLRKDIELALMMLFDPNRNLPQIYENLLDNQELIVQSVNVDGGDVAVDIGGDLMGIGACADPILEAQIIQTIFQFDTVQTVKVMNGGTNLRQFIDMSGQPDLVNYVYRRS